MRISISDSHMTYGYKPIDVPFLALPSITSRFNYSCGLFSGGKDEWGKHHEGYRTRACLVGMSEILMYDFDDGYPMDGCLEFLENTGITAYIATSRSHQKWKKEKYPPCDRYRLMIPFDSALDLPFGEYQQFYKFIAELLGINTLIDGATIDPTRFFFPNPEQEHHFVLTGQMLSFDFLCANFHAWRDEQAEAQEAEQEKKKNEQRRNRAKPENKKGLKSNELSRYTTIETRKGNFQFQDFEYLTGDQTAPCRCPNPSHPDKDPSAFIGRSKSSGRLMVRCSSGHCQFLAFMGDE